MKNLLLLLLFIAPAALLAFNAQEIIKQCEQKQGYEKLSTFNTIELHGEVKSQQGNTTLFYLLKGKDKKRIEVKNGQNEMLYIKNGDNVRLMNNGQKMDANPQVIQEFESGADVIKSPFSQLDGTGFKPKLEGEKLINGEPCYRLLYTKEKEETTIEFYISKKELVVLKSVVTNVQGKMEFQIITDFTDFKNVGGVIVPMRTITDNAGMISEFIIRDIKLDKPIADSNFAI